MCYSCLPLNQNGSSEDSNPRDVEALIYLGPREIGLEGRK